MLKSFKAQRKSEIIKLISSEDKLKGHAQVYRYKIFNSSLVFLLIPATALFLNFAFPATQPYWLYCLVISSTLLLLCLNGLAHKWAELSVCQQIINEADNTYHEYHELIATSDIEQHKELISSIFSALKGELCGFVREKYGQYVDELTVHLESLEHKKNLRTLRKCSKRLQATNKQKIALKLEQHPLMVVKKQLQSGLATLEARREDLQTQWDIAYEDFSWWQKLTTERPNFSELDGKIAELKLLKEEFKFKHEEDVEQIQKQYAEALSRSTQRINDAYKTAYEIIQENRGACPASNKLLQKASWCSAFAISASLWDDFNRAGNIYDSLRSVNQNFQGMSDIEIWWETLWMSSDSLNGLASLTKGAYFEQLVAGDTGGALFEHFNHKDTDIIIDGVAIQLKATDSISYIESVDSGIPVIATSEVAEKTDAIDSGFLNAELSDSIDLALGGTVIDFADTTADTIFAGLGGLGLFATLRGIGHAARKFNNGGDGVEAIFEGTGIAIVGTANPTL